MKDFFKKYFKDSVKVILLLFVLVLVSLALMAALYELDVFYYNGEATLNSDFFIKYSKNVFGIIGILLFQIIITIILSPIMNTSMAFTVLYQVIYINPIFSFMMAISGSILSGLAMYYTGKYGINSAIKGLIGEEKCTTVCKLVNKHGAIYFPLMILFPFFPDDTLVMIAGTIKMKFSWFIPSFVISKIAGIATIIFVLSEIPYHKFTSIWHYVLFICAFIMAAAILFYIAYKVNSRRILKNKD